MKATSDSKTCGICTKPCGNSWCPTNKEKQDDKTTTKPADPKDNGSGGKQEPKK